MYYYLAAFLFFSSHLLYGAQKKFKPFFDKHEDQISVAYDIAPSPYIRLAAQQITTSTNREPDYIAEYTLNPTQQNPKEIYWVKLSAQDALALFITLEKEYARYSELLDAHQKKKEKTCIKEEDRETHTTTYTQTKEGVKCSASRMLMHDGREIFCCDSTEDSDASPEKLYNELEQIYQAENQY